MVDHAGQDTGAHAPLALDQTTLHELSDGLPNGRIAKVELGGQQVLRWDLLTLRVGRVDDARAGRC